MANKEHWLMLLQEENDARALRAGWRRCGITKKNKLIILEKWSEG